MARLTWYGSSVDQAYTDACKAGIDRTMADCVQHAQQPPASGGAPVVTGWLSSNITFTPAQEEGVRLVGYWGNIYEPDYAIIVNLRNPYLQRAADAQYGNLEGHIKKALNETGSWW